MSTFSRHVLQHKPVEHVKRIERPFLFQKPQRPQTGQKRKADSPVKYMSANVVVEPNKEGKVISTEFVDGVNSDLDKITDEVMTPKQTTDGGDFESEAKQYRPKSGARAKTQKQSPNRPKVGSFEIYLLMKKTRVKSTTRRSNRNSNRGEMRFGKMNKNSSRGGSSKFNRIRKPVNLSETGIDPNPFMAFENAQINKNYLIIKKQNENDRLVREQVGIELLYDPSALTSPGQPKNVGIHNQLWRSTHPYDQQSNRIPIVEQQVTYDKFQTNTRRFGKLGRGNCNMNYLYEGRYPDTTIGSTQDKSNESITIKKATKKDGKKQPTNLNFTELNEKHVKGCYQMSKQLGRNGEWGAKAHTQASYNPSHGLLTLWRRSQ